MYNAVFRKNYRSDLCRSAPSYWTPSGSLVELADFDHVSCQRLRSGYCFCQCLRSCNNWLSFAWGRVDIFAMNRELIASLSRQCTRRRWSQQETLKYTARMGSQQPKIHDFPLYEEDARKKFSPRGAQILARPVTSFGEEPGAHSATEAESQETPGPT